MSEHTPTPWKTDGVYIVAPLGPTIADCKKSPSMEIGTARLNAAFIVKACNAHDKLVKALEEIVKYSTDRFVYDVANAALASLKEPS